MLNPKLADFRTLIWDLDGTILDSYKISLEIWTELLKDRGIDLDPSVLRRNYHGTLVETCEAILPEVYRSDIDAILAEFISKDDVHMREVDRHLFEDAVDLIVRAHKLGHRQIIVTNRMAGGGRVNASPHNVIKNSKISHCITKIICGDEVEHRKPKLQVLQGIDYDPSTTLVIGDQHVDVHFAHNLNTHAFLVNRHSEQFFDLPPNHTIIESLNLIK